MTMMATMTASCRTTTANVLQRATADNDCPLVDDDDGDDDDDSFDSLHSPFQTFSIDKRTCTLHAHMFVFCFFFC